MKKILIGFALLFFSGSMALIASSEETVYKIGMEESSVPYVYKEKGKLVGLDPDMLSEIAKIAKFKYEIVHYDFSTCLEKLKAGELDGVMNNLFVTPKRKEDFDFSVPYWKDYASFVVYNHNMEVNEMEDFEGIKIGVKKGTVFQNYSTDLAKEIFAKNKQVVFNTNDDLYKALRTDQIQAVYANDSEIKTYLKEKEPFHIVGKPLREFEVSFAVKKGKNRELLQKVDEAIENLKQREIYEKILEKYTPHSYQETAVANFDSEKKEKEKDGGMNPVITYGLIGMVLVLLLYVIHLKLKENK
ncbi:MAG: ABC transporter substrate-binding protein [Streptococcaceae bacterium]|jgi:polar amino acid transport system substrate-binding protein|nr:ABC transporter substrate-binding protein [Streptococcaceae bacterium]